MSQANGIREVGFFDCAGGGQVVVDDGYAYIGHMESPHGTTVVDVRDPKRPARVAEFAMPPGTHSHKVRVANGVMVVNHEVLDERQAPSYRGGLGIYDVSDPHCPREIAVWETTGKGVHRFDFDGEFVYGSPTVDGFLGNIAMIIDLRDPARPSEVGRWWMPGQWKAGGETPSWRGTQHRCHHPLRLGDRLYTSYWHGGFVILDIADMAKPRLVAALDWSPPFVCPTYSAVPVPFEIRGRRMLVVADEDVQPIKAGPPAFLWLVDVTDETRPTPVASYQVAELDGSPQPPMSGCHQPIEKIRDTEIPVAWFAQGLRVLDIANPHAPREVASYVPDPVDGERVSSNDVFLDERGVIYLIDRIRGLHILERT